MRELKGQKRSTKVSAMDEPGHGNACHCYFIAPAGLPSLMDECIEVISTIAFQKGPVKEVGVNGCHNEDLLAIVIDRLEGFQSGDLACDENAGALICLEKALWWLDKRTNDRIKREVEGTSQS